MAEEISDTGGTDADEHPDRDGLDVGHMFGDDADAVGEGSKLNVFGDVFVHSDFNDTS